MFFVLVIVGTVHQAFVLERIVVYVYVNAMLVTSARHHVMFRIFTLVHIYWYACTSDNDGNWKMYM